jgi:transcriptional regulator with XRE-family HTH domain
MLFNERLRQIREERDKLQKEVADYIGVSERVYGYYEDNRFPRDPIILGKIADYFNINLLYLMGLSDDKEPNQKLERNQIGVIRVGNKDISLSKLTKIIEFAELSGLLDNDKADV